MWVGGFHWRGQTQNDCSAMCIPVSLFSAPLGHRGHAPITCLTNGSPVGGIRRIDPDADCRRGRVRLGKAPNSAVPEWEVMWTAAAAPELWGREV